MRATTGYATTMDEILEFWFGSTDLLATPPAAVQARWFRPDPAFDREIADRFGSVMETRVESWCTTPAGALAATIVLDQFPRNVHRGDARAFVSDARARAVADAAVTAGWDANLGMHQRLFLYLPFEHAEDLAYQERSLRLVRALGDPRYLAYAEQHHAAIVQFGRFPGRNEALGRVDTPAEAAWRKSQLP